MMLLVLLDHCKCKVKYKSISSNISNVICSGAGENAPQVCITVVEVQNPSLLGVKYFLSYADLTTQGSFVLRVLSCVDPNLSLSFHGDCPLAYTFWRLISLKAFYTLPNCSKAIRNRCPP